MKRDVISKLPFLTVFSAGQTWTGSREILFWLRVVGATSNKYKGNKGLSAKLCDMENNSKRTNKTNPLITLTIWKNLNSSFGNRNREERPIFPLSSWAGKNLFPINNNFVQTNRSGFKKGI